MQSSSPSGIQVLLDQLGPTIIGQRLRRARMRQNRSIREVAAQAGLSKTSVVKVEAGERARPATVGRLCEALGLHVGRLADPADEGNAPVSVHRHADDRWVDLNDTGGGFLLGADRPLSPSERNEAVTSGASLPVCIIQNQLSGGRVLPSILELHEPSELKSHPGEEFVHVLSGRAKIEVAGTVYTLNEGESITFWSAEPHRYLPAGPQGTPARLLSVRVDG
ncbi:MAG: XRE family transcriptional regulator [Bacteroidota bacterium]